MPKHTSPQPRNIAFALALAACVGLGFAPPADAQTAAAAAAPAGAEASTAAEDAFTTAELEKRRPPCALSRRAPGAGAALLRLSDRAGPALALARQEQGCRPEGRTSPASTIKAGTPRSRLWRALAPVVDQLNKDLDATTDLGDAFVNQPDDVAKVIQDLRQRAEKAGSLKTTSEAARHDADAGRPKLCRHLTPPTRV